ncbi:MAG: hypothetical protein ACR2RL_09165 [Gammaproteobacteria bacterium]
MQLFASQPVVELATIRAALGGVSSMTAFRHLKRLGYRCSYNHKGRYYARHELARYDRFGLWSVGDIHFSVDGSLRKTVRRLVEQAHAGATHQELQARLHVRVHNTLLELYRNEEVERERLQQLYVYVDADASVRARQLQRRHQLLSQAQRADIETEVTDQLIIEVLLVLLHHPGAERAEVVRRLRGHSPPLSMQHVSVVFARYHLDELGEKGGATNC